MYSWSGLLPSLYLSQYLNEGLKAGSVSCWICAGQDTLFKPCRALACLRHSAQEHEAVSQAESLFRYMLYAFHEGSIFTTTADIGFTLHSIWWNSRLLWKGWPQSVLLCHVFLLLPSSHINWLWSSRAGWWKISLPKIAKSAQLGQLMEPCPLG